MTPTLAKYIACCQRVDDYRYLYTVTDNTDFKRMYLRWQTVELINLLAK